MEKVTKLLEKYVEYIALGLGAIWILYIVFAFGINSPVHAPLPAAKPGQRAAEYGPGQIDEAILSGVAKRLDDLMATSKAPTSAEPDHVARFREKMGESPPQIQLANVFDSAPAGIVRLPDDPRNPPPALVRADQPKVPAATILGLNTGRSQVKVAANPGAAVGPAAGGRGNVPLTEVDKDWVRVFLSLDVAAWQANLAAARVPAKQVNDALPPCVLRVEVVRVEVLPNGADGPEVVLPRIALPGQDPVPDMPDVPEKQIEFKDWAKTHQEIILRPAYYELVRGDNPMRAMGDAPPVVVPVVTTKPAVVKPPVTKPVVKPPVVPTYPPLKGKGYYIAPQPSGREYYYITDEAAARQLLTVVPFRRPVDDGLPPDRGVPVVPPPAGVGVDPAVPRAPVAALPLQEFWVFDDTVQEGKTYKYKARVILPNPLFNTVNMAQDPKVATIFALPTDRAEAWSEWSQTVTIPPKTHFFIVGQPPVMGLDNKPSRNEVKVVIFKWQNGGWNPTEVFLGLGDPIPQTSFSIAEIRSVRNWKDCEVLLMDESGTTVSRKVQTDSHDPLLQELRNQIAASVSVVKP